MGRTYYFEAKMIKILGVMTHFKLREDKDGKEIVQTGGVDLVRTILPLQNLPKDQFEVDITYKPLEEKFTDVESLAKHYDILYFSYMEKIPLYLKLRVAGILHKMKVCMDVDDNLWDVHPSHPHYDEYKEGSEENFNRSAIMLDVDFLTTTSDYLKKRITQHIGRKDIAVMPNFIDLKLYDYKKIPKVPHELTIGWMGGASHLPDITRKEFTNAMTRILNKYPKVKFKTTAYFPQLKALWGHQYTYTLARFNVYKFIEEIWPEMMSTCDIFVAPLSHSEYSSAKSYIKLLEYGAGKKPVVAERIEPYQQFGENGVYLAYSENEWFDYLDKLIQSEDLRTSQGFTLYNEIQKHTADKSSKLYADFFNKVYKAPFKQFDKIKEKD